MRRGSVERETLDGFFHNEEVASSARSGCRAKNVWRCNFYHSLWGLSEASAFVAGHDPIRFLG